MPRLIDILPHRRPERCPSATLDLRLLNDIGVTRSSLPTLLFSPHIAEINRIRGL